VSFHSIQCCENACETVETGGRRRKTATDADDNPKSSIKEKGKISEWELIKLLRLRLEEQKNELHREKLTPKKIFFSNR
jgi:hypothetical protein